MDLREYGSAQCICLTKNSNVNITPSILIWVYHADREKYYAGLDEDEYYTNATTSGLIRH